MSAGKRVKYIDIARGIAILCIILGHFGVYEVDRVVFTFHVPIFYVITGYFLSKKHDVKTFVKDKARTLLVPYGITCVAMVLFSMIFAVMLRESVVEAALQWTAASIYGSGVNYTEPFTIHKIGAIWFLLSSFWGSVFFRFSLEMKKKVRLIFILALFCIGYLTTIKCFWFPFSIQAGCCATLFMYFGYLARKSKELYADLSKEVKNATVAFAFIVWLAFIKNYESFWLVENNFGRGVVDIFGSLCACFCVIVISRFIEKHSKLLTNGLAYLGKYSLIVLCVHILELNQFPWRYIEIRILNLGITQLMTDCIIAGIRIVFIIVVTVILSKIKWITNLFGMKSTK